MSATTGAIKLIIGLILVIIAIYWIYTDHVSREALNEKHEKQLAALEVKEQAAIKETQDFIDRGCVPTTQQYVWECPTR